MLLSINVTVTINGVLYVSFSNQVQQVCNLSTCHYIAIVCSQAMSIFMVKIQSPIDMRKTFVFHVIVTSLGGKFPT